MADAKKIRASAAVGLLGCVALAVPVFDMAEDVLVGDKTPLSTVVENSPLVVLGLVIVGTAVWLATSDWETTHVGTVARIAVLFSTGAVLLVALVVLVQMRLQGDLKPFIIAADAAVIGIIGSVIVGLRTAQEEQVADEAAAQRDRFQALFDNVPNPIVGVEFVGDVPIVRAVNPAFTEVFGFDRRTIIDEDLEQYIVPPDQDLDPVDRPIAPKSPDDQEAWDSDVIELETVDGRREFIRLTAPVERGPARDGYAIYIDVTVQRQRRERLRVLSRTLRHDIRNKLSVVQGMNTVAEELDGRHRKMAELAADAADDLHEMAEKTRRIEQQIAGESDPHPRDLAEVVTDAAAAVRSDFPDATIDVTVPVTAYGDITTAFGTAVEGVIRNGVEHNDSDEPVVEVAVAESLDGEYVDIRVADNGPGIEPKQARIVEGELKADQRTTHLDGLGLWTARWVMQNSGGDIEFAANSPRGTVVTLRVPATEEDNLPE